MIEVIGKHLERILVKSHPVQLQLSNFHCETTIDLSNFEVDSSSIESIRLFCLVPVFPERLVSCKGSPCQTVQMKHHNLGTFPPVGCQCQKYSNQRLVRLHHCCSGLLVGQWEKSNIAFVHASYTLANIDGVLKSLLSSR